MADTPSTATSTGDTITSLLGDLLKSNTGKGAALGALMSTLLSSYKGPGGVNVGVDMSKVGNIPARTTTVSAPRYLSYGDYGARDIQPQAVTPELRKALGLPADFSMPTATQYTAKPSAITTQAAKDYTSAGTGVNKMIAPTLTPRSSTTINPLLGGLLGASLGYLMPETQAYTASGATGAAKSAMDTLFGKVGNLITGSGGTTIPNYYYDTTTVKTDPDTGYQYTEFPVYKDGGMASPLMAANGGAVEDPSYYTFGQIVDPQEILNQLSHGGQPKQGGLHVPVIEGRHDYRAGARVTGAGDGQSDDIPAMLADGEYVIDSETVAQLGNGSTKAGSDLLDKFREEIRAHKRSAPVHKIPPPSKSPLQYLAAAQKKVRS